MAAIDDLAVKAVGLAQFADKNWARFDSIQLIRKQRGPDGKEHFYRLDVGKAAVRMQVLAISSNDQFDGLFVQSVGMR